MHFLLWLLSRNKHPTDSTPPSSNDSNSHHNKTNIGTHQGIHRRNPRNNKKNNTSAKIYDHKNQSQQTHSKYQGIIQNSSASNYYSDQNDGLYQLHKPTTNSQ